MKKTALLKDTVREIKKSLGRFLSIFAIVGIGVAFFAGVRDSVPVMKNTADGYYDDYNFMDMKVMSTIGMTKEDSKAMKDIKGVEGVYASHSMDALSTKDNHQRVFKLLSYPMNAKQDDPDYINQIRLIKGRLPKKEDECVIEYTNIRGAEYQVGDKITFASGNDESIDESLKRKTYTIVGEVTIPYYLSYEKGSSSIGSGSIDNYAILPDVNFKSEYYSELYLTVQGAKDVNSYSDAYFDIIDPTTKAVKKVSEQRAEDRFEDIRKEALDKIADGRKEYEKSKKRYEDEINKAKQTLENSRIDLKNGEAELATQKKQGEATLASKEEELRNGEATLAQSTQEYEDSLAAFNAKKPEMIQGQNLLKQKLQETQQQLPPIEKQLADVNAALQNPSLPEETRAQLTAQKAQLEGAKAQIKQGIATIEQNLNDVTAQISDAENKLKAANEQINTAKAQLDEGRQQLSSGRAQLERETSQAAKQLEDGRRQLREGEAELAKQEKDGAEKLRKAKEELDRNEEDIKAMKEPDVYVLDRHSHYSYMDYGSAADRMGAIAKIFPLFFFLVSALVCLTTMTRMVDEQRQEIGTLKALGYSKGSIAFKYITYSAVASILGGIFGAIIGMIIFPTVIFNAWGIMYTLPEVSLDPDIPLGILAVSLASIITVTAAVAACYKELMETPALLMRPKAPKNGKKILLERFTLVWKHFNFIQKVTARNIFRYKKRFFMTVIGISGCSALLVAGFGIQDSIGEIATKQYEEIFKFDVSMQYENDIKLSQKEKALKELKEHKGILDATEMAVYHGFYADKGEDKGVDLYVSLDQKEFKNFISLRTRVNHDTVELSDNGAVITEKLAKDKHLSIGDTFKVDNGDGVKKSVKITGICENYVGHALYMSKDYYKSVYHKEASATAMYAIMKDTSTEAETELGNTFMKHKAIDSISFYSGIASSFQDTIASLSIVIVVLIISAGLLAFVVLYNLTNVNISERLREIATIKVLGFYDNEVSAYVYRENIILTLIGGCVGLVLGIGLHHLIMSLAELDTVMFGRNINLISFFYALAITMVFAVIVNLVMYRKLKKIPMVESLKSVE